MASPQEVIEQSIPHPADSTRESRRAASTRVIRALAANEYAFMRRRGPVLEQDDGECQHCKREAVHVDHGEVYMDALQRMQSLRAKLTRMEDALLQIAGDPAGAQALARKALGWIA
jgi:hypothetical protein